MIPIEEAIEQEETINFIVNPAILPTLVEMLAERGFELKWVTDDSGGLWYVAAPKALADNDEVWVQFYDLGFKMWLDLDYLTRKEAEEWVAIAPGYRRVKP